MAQEKISLSNKYGYYLEGTKKGRTLIDGTDLIVKHTGSDYENFDNYHKYAYKYIEKTKGTISTKGGKTYLTGEYSTSSKSRKLDGNKCIRDYTRCYSEYDEYYRILGDFTVSNMSDSSFRLKKFKNAKRIVINPVEISQIKIDTIFHDSRHSDTISYRLKINKKEGIVDFSCFISQNFANGFWNEKCTYSILTGKIPIEKMGKGDFFDLIDTFKIQYPEGFFVGTISKHNKKLLWGYKYDMMNGTFYFNTGEIYKGNINVAEGHVITHATNIFGIPMDGEWTLRDGSKKTGNWIWTDFSDDEQNEISRGKNILDQLQIINDILEQNKKYRRDFPEILKVTKEELEDKGKLAAAEKGYKILIEVADKIHLQGPDVDSAKMGLLRVQQKQEQKRKEEIKQRLVNKYGTKWADLIEKKKLTIGMPRDAVFEFMPEYVYIPNKITTGSHVTETYRVDMSNAYMWVISEAKKEGGDAGLRLLYEQAMMIKMYGGNPDTQFEKAIREMLPKLEFKDGKLASFSSY